jgi:molybdate transport system substrate-binding protein
MRLFLLLLLLSPALYADDILIAVAANFAAPMQDIARQFENQTGHSVKLSYGSSGKFYAQITHGAPFDMFFSADRAKPEALERDRKTVPDSRFTYAIGQLVLWSRDDDLIKASAEVLRNGQFNKLALANPRLAPYGLAAQQTLEHLGLRSITEAKWVQGENIAQTYQFVSTGNAELGFVAGSQVLKQEKLVSGSAWLVPSELHAPILQDAVVLKIAENRPVVHEFIAYLKSPEGAAIIRRYGYLVAE